MLFIAIKTLCEFTYFFSMIYGEIEYLTKINITFLFLLTFTLKIVKNAIFSLQILDKRVREIVILQERI